MKNRTMGLLVTIFALTGASIYADHHCGCSRMNRQKTVHYAPNKKQHANVNHQRHYNMNHNQNQGLVGGTINAAENVTEDAISAAENVAEAPFEMLGF